MQKEKKINRLTLLTKTIKIRWNSKTKKHYEEKGCVYTKPGDEFEVKVEDLTDGSSAKVEVKCDCPDCKNPYLKPMAWTDYLKYIHEDGKYYCNKCAVKLFATEKMKNTKLKNSISFEQWCYDNLDIDYANEILSRWDTEKNRCLPSEITYCSTRDHQGYWFKCNKGIHESELKNIHSFVKTSKESKKSNALDCKKCNSFKQWCYDNLDFNRANEILSKWDYELNVDKNGNIVKPCDINCGSQGIDNKGYWFKCLKHPEHGSEQKRISDFIRLHAKNGKSEIVDCIKCKSFDQWCKDNNYEHILDLWDYEMNKCSPIDISYCSHTKYYFKCPRGIHKSTLKGIKDFTIGNGNIICYECGSFGQYLIDLYGENAVELYWSKENKHDPFKIPKNTGRTKVKIICQNDKTHPDYELRCNDFHNKGCRCPICSESKGEKRIGKYFTKKNISYIPQKTYEELFGLGGSKLRYDFYLPEYNICIEYHGEQHYKSIPFYGGDEGFATRVYHDALKQAYCQDNNIPLLIIPFWDYDKIEEILQNTIREYITDLPPNTAINT